MEQNLTPTKKTSKYVTSTLLNCLSLDVSLVIATHQQVDADAAFSAALLKVLKPTAIVFVRADQPSLNQK